MFCFKSFPRNVTRFRVRAESWVVQRRLESTEATSSYTRSNPKTILTAELDPQVAQKFQQGLHHKKHSGRRYLGTIQLPPFLERSAIRIIKRYNSAQFRDDVFRMYERVFHHQMPPEPSEIRQKAKEIQGKVVANENVDFSVLTPEEKEYVLEKRRRKVAIALKRETYNWKEVEYTEYASVVYLAARLGANYAALRSVFHEIRLNDPTFSPQTMFDFGSGLGTTMFVANEVWPKSINEHFNVDLSGDMNDVSRLLLKGGDEEQPLLFNGVYYRQFLPVSHAVKYDLVVSAFSLLELPNERSRINVIENLWHKTQDMLVLIEHGNRDGFGAILEARNLILETTGHNVTRTFHANPDLVEMEQMDPNRQPTSHIVAPCPHHYPCPRLHTGGPVLCNYQSPYFPVDFGQPHMEVKNERYSYIVLRKGPKTKKEQPSWPRIVQEVINKKGHTICRLCCPDGEIKSVTFTKSKHKGDMFKCAKQSRWGDMLPVTVKEVEKPITRHEIHLIKKKEEQRAQEEEGEKASQAEKTNV